MGSSESDTDDQSLSLTFTYSPAVPEQPVTAIVEAVAWVRGTDPLDLEPLEHVIDTEQLAALVGKKSIAAGDDRNGARSLPPEVELTFRYEQCIVTVTPGTIRIRYE